MQPYTFVLLCGLAGSVLAQNYVPFNGATWDNFASRPPATNPVTALTDSIPSVWQTEKPTPRTTDLLYTSLPTPQSSKDASSPLGSSSASLSVPSAPSVSPSASASSSVSVSVSVSESASASTVPSSTEVASSSPTPTTAPASSSSTPSSTSTAPASSSSRAAAYVFRADYVGVVAGSLFAGLIL